MLMCRLIDIFVLVVAMHPSVLPELPIPNERELSIIRRAQEKELFELADASKLKGGLSEAIARFTTDIPPLDALLPSSIPGKWYGAFDVVATDAEVRKFYAHYFEEPKARGILDPGNYGTTQMMMDRTTMNLARLGRIKGPKPLVANLPTGDIGATIMRVPRSDRAIMFYPSGLYIFLGDFAKIVAHFFRELDNNLIRSDADLRENTIFAPIYPGYARWLVQAVSSVTVEDHPLRVDRAPKARETGFLSMQLMNYSQMFIFAHEVAHQELGHLNSNNPQPDQYRADEYAADRFALEAVCEITRQDKGSWALGFWGCQFALISFELINRALTIFDRRPPDAPWISTYYPSVADRRAALYEHAKRTTDPEAFAASVEVVEMTVQALSKLQHASELELISMRAMVRDVRPAPIWRQYLTQHFGTKLTEVL